MEVCDGLTINKLKKKESSEEKYDIIRIFLTAEITTDVPLLSSPSIEEVMGVCRTIAKQSGKSMKASMVSGIKFTRRVHLRIHYVEIIQ